MPQHAPKQWQTQYKEIPTLPPRPNYPPPLPPSHPQKYNTHNIENNLSLIWPQNNTSDNFSKHCSKMLSKAKEKVENFLGKFMFEKEGKEIDIFPKGLG